MTGDQPNPELEKAKANHERMVKIAGRLLLALPITCIIGVWFDEWRIAISNAILFGGALLATIGTAMLVRDAE